MYRVLQTYSISDKLLSKYRQNTVVTRSDYQIQGRTSDITVCINERYIEALGGSLWACMVPSHPAQMAETVLIEISCLISQAGSRVVLLMTKEPFSEEPIQSVY